ncbi:hypothetical protein BCR37DRAFT_376547 [Protomyces lactucae-debilis]|uniref:C2H2-type domain-containing protein n=1 Tax=Protomyces lactucae-debilis TaxID=2754530 RepID=A0A1Y2FT10_PROLT|nr:uncharacterized protein BCR37DRAFT_376547 [Protomyces lactucae-debilis]ORY87140.1 hypothetical protein BCR37DRAFT_376547 [Protomyces lactucae-debilis]
MASATAIHYCNNIRDGLRAARGQHHCTPADLHSPGPALDIDAKELHDHLAALHSVEACDCTSCEACLASTYNSGRQPQLCHVSPCHEPDCLVQEHCDDCVSVCDDAECNEQCMSVCDDAHCQEHAVDCCPDVRCELDTCVAAPCMPDCMRTASITAANTASQAWPTHDIHAWPLDGDTHAMSGLHTPLSIVTDGSLLSPSDALQPPDPQLPDSHVPFHCHWNACDLAFFDATQFDQHFWVEHAHQQAQQQQQQSLHCAWNDCAVAPPNETALFDHVKHDHVETETHHRCKWLVPDANGQCHPCGACLPTVEELSLHISELHVGKRKKSYVCGWQGCERHQRPFTQRQKMMRHLVTHTGDRPFVCPECGYQCSEECVLEQHMRTHTGERPFACTLCGKAFSASTALSVHMRTHTGYKPLVCKFPGCGKRFSESSNLAKHMRTHSAQKSYACSVPGCNKAFQRPDQLKRHVSKLHKGASCDAMKDGIAQ